MKVSRVKRMAAGVGLAALAACGGGKADAARAAGPEARAAAHDVIAAVGALAPEEVHAYRLTLDRIRAYHRAWMAAERVFADDPSLRPPGGQDALLRIVERNPALVGTFRAEGLSPREGP
jgi:hypothetical protein